MNIKKIETNFKRKLFLSESKVSSKKYSDKLENQVLNVYQDIKYNTFYGFGGAITDSSAYCYSLLPDDKKQEFLNSYYSKDNSNYQIARISIGSSDFSQNSYSYAKSKDLNDFSIDEDKKYLIPLIKQIQSINPDIKFLASPWSPPKFMKNTKLLTLGGKILDKYKQTYADYLSKFILEYKKLGITIDFITVQNEPNAVQIWESCLYNPDEEVDFIINYLYPTFKSNNINTKIVIWDHNKEKLLSRANAELKNQNANEAISGIAYHWYSGDHFENISLVHELYPDKILIHTEGCTGYSNFRESDEIKNAEIYGHDILGDLLNGTNYFIDWNILLDEKGGPNHKSNFCNSPIMLKNNNKSFYKNLTYYYITHFSKYIKPNAKRLAISRYTLDIQMVAFENTDNSIIVILLNTTNTQKEYSLSINNEFYIHDNLDSHAIVTYEIKK